MTNVPRGTGRPIMTTWRCSSSEVFSYLGISLEYQQSYGPGPTPRQSQSAGGDEEGKEMLESSMNRRSP